MATKLRSDRWAPTARCWLLALLALSALLAACDDTLPAFALPPPVDAGSQPDGSSARDAASADVDAGTE